MNGFKVVNEKKFTVRFKEKLKKGFLQQRFGVIGVRVTAKVGFVLGSWFFIRYIWLTKSPTDAKPRDVVRHLKKTERKTNATIL